MIQPNLELSLQEVSQIMADMSGHCVIGRHAMRLNIGKMIFAKMRRKRSLLNIFSVCVPIYVKKVSIH